MARLEQLSGIQATCSITEFAAWMKVSRQAVYNWKDSNSLNFSEYFLSSTCIYFLSVTVSFFLKDLCKNVVI